MEGREKFPSEIETKNPVQSANMKCNGVNSKGVKCSLKVGGQEKFCHLHLNQKNMNLPTNAEIFSLLAELNQLSVELRQEKDKTDVTMREVIELFKENTEEKSTKTVILRDLDKAIAQQIQLFSQ